MKHKCPADGCDRQISNRFAFCYRHWMKLSVESKREVYRSLDKNGAGSGEHIETLRRAAATLGERNLY